MVDLYEAEDQVFRLAAWLKAKEDGASDADAGKVARKSFLDYSINAPWVQMMRSTAFPFIAFTYRSVPMLLDTMANKPWKLMKLGLLAAAVNALGYALSGGDEDDERRLLGCCIRVLRLNRLESLFRVYIYVDFNCVKIC